MGKKKLKSPKSEVIEDYEVPIVDDDWAALKEFDELQQYDLSNGNGAEAGDDLPSLSGGGGGVGGTSAANTNNKENAHGSAASTTISQLLTLNKSVCSEPKKRLIAISALLSLTYKPANARLLSSLPYILENVGKAAYEDISNYLGIRLPCTKLMSNMLLHALKELPFRYPLVSDSYQLKVVMIINNGLLTGINGDDESIPFTIEAISRMAKFPENRLLMMETRGLFNQLCAIAEKFASSPLSQSSSSSSSNSNSNSSRNSNSHSPRSQLDDDSNSNSYSSDSGSAASASASAIDMTTKVLSCISSILTCKKSARLASTKTTSLNLLARIVKLTPLDSSNININSDSDSSLTRQASTCVKILTSIIRSCPYHQITSIYKLLLLANNNNSNNNNSNSINNIINNSITNVDHAYFDKYLPGGFNRISYYISVHVKFMSGEKWFTDLMLRTFKSVDWMGAIPGDICDLRVSKGKGKSKSETVIVEGGSIDVENEGLAFIDGLCYRIKAVKNCLSDDVFGERLLKSWNGNGNGNGSNNSSNPLHMLIQHVTKLTSRVSASYFVESSSSKSYALALRCTKRPNYDAEKSLFDAYGEHYKVVEVSLLKLLGACYGLYANLMRYPSHLQVMVSDCVDEVKVKSKSKSASSDDNENSIILQSIKVFSAMSSATWFRAYNKPSSYLKDLQGGEYDEVCKYSEFGKLVGALNDILFAALGVIQNVLSISTSTSSSIDKNKNKNSYILKIPEVGKLFIKVIKNIYCIPSTLFLQSHKSSQNLTKYTVIRGSVLRNLRLNVIRIGFVGCSHLFGSLPETGNSKSQMAAKYKNAMSLIDSQIILISFTLKSSRNIAVSPGFCERTLPMIVSKKVFGGMEGKRYDAYVFYEQCIYSIFVDQVFRNIGNAAGLESDFADLVFVGRSGDDDGARLDGAAGDADKRSKTSSSRIGIEVGSDAALLDYVSVGSSGFLEGKFDVYHRGGGFDEKEKKKEAEERVDKGSFDEKEVRVERIKTRTKLI